MNIFPRDINILYQWEQCVLYWLKIGLKSNHSSNNLICRGFFQFAKNHSLAQFSLGDQDAKKHLQNYSNSIVLSTFVDINVGGFSENNSKTLR